MTANFNQILIVDSIPEGELNTAQRLAEDLHGWCAVLGNQPAVVVQRIASAAEFGTILHECAALVRRDLYIPLLHVECHGSDEGLQFADGSQMRWTALKPLLTDLNLASKLNLIVVLAACSGSDIATTVQITERAPFYGFLAPKRAIDPHGLEGALAAFYQTLLTTHDAQAALAALQATDAGDAFLFVSSRTMYRMTVRAYNERHGTDEAIATRSQRLEARAAGCGYTVSAAEFEIELRNPAIIERFQEQFFMADLYPENAQRFA